MGWPIRKNDAGGAVLVFPIYDADGDLVTGAADLDSEISKDGGAFADVTAEAAEIGTSGFYSLALAQAEINADYFAVITKTSTAGAKTAANVVYTSTENIDDLATAIAALNDLSAAEVAAEFATYDGPTKTEMDSGFAGLNDIDGAAVQAELVIYDAATGGEVAALNDLSAAQVAAELATYDGPTKTEMDSGFAALNDPTVTEIATAVFQIDMDAVEGAAPVHSLTSAVLKATSKIEDDAGTLKTYKTDGITVFMSQTVTTDAGLDPIDGLGLAA